MIPRNATPLLNGDASFDEIQRIYRAARKATKWTGGESANIIDKQAYLRNVSAEFYRRLDAAQVYVENWSDR